MTNQPTDDDVREENKKIKKLRFLVDLTLLTINTTDLTHEESMKLVTAVKRVALALFPGKEETFDLIYLPRFTRAISQKFGFH
ncbi:MAG: hypothetical protein HQK57_10515 [Deltaproteobacteria bacterium]|nr:hypothetical protein [Deltaproteobacteria bacterium]